MCYENEHPAKEVSEILARDFVLRFDLFHVSVFLWIVYRLSEFDDVLDADEIDTVSLSKICFHGTSVTVYTIDSEFSYLYY